MKRNDVSGVPAHFRKDETRMNLVTLLRRATLYLGCGLLALGLAGSAQAQSCQLNSPSGKIKHVVYMEFDNVHFTRDNPNVPSDLEQMPNLLNFLKDKGTLDAGDHNTKLTQGNHSVKLSAGASTVEAMQSITLKVGSNSITIDNTGVTIKGMMVSIQGQMQVEMKGAMASVNADGILTLKGSMTMIN